MAQEEVQVAKEVKEVKEEVAKEVQEEEQGDEQGEEEEQVCYLPGIAGEMGPSRPHPFRFLGPGVTIHPNTS